MWGSRTDKARADYRKAATYLRLLNTVKQCPGNAMFLVCVCVFLALKPMHSEPMDSKAHDTYEDIRIRLSLGITMGSLRLHSLHIYTYAYI